MSDHHTPKEREIAIFWDYENIPLPAHVSPAEAAKAIQTAVSKYGRRIEMRRVYFDPNKDGRRPRDPSGLDSSGFDLVHTPSRNTKETLDKKLIVDVLAFAWDCSVRNRTPCVVLITSDGDYAYTLSKLRDRGVMNVVMYGPECQTADILVDNAEVALSFNRDVLSLVATKAASATDAKPSKSSLNAALQSGRSQKRRDSNHSTSSKSIQKSHVEVPHHDGKRSYLFVRKLPRLTQTKELAEFIESTFNIPVRLIGMESYRKDPTIRFAHVELVNESDAEFLADLSAGKEILFKGCNLEIKINDTPPSIDELRKLSAEPIYKMEGTALPEGAQSGGKGSQLDDFDQDVVAYCVCLTIKQKSWSMKKKVSDKECWVPNGIVWSAYQPVHVCVSHEDARFTKVYETARNRAIDEGYVETARHKLKDKDSYVAIPLDEPTRNLSTEFFLRLSDMGQELAGDAMSAGVKKYCSTLHKKQKDWQYGTKVPFDRCWIPLHIMEDLFIPLYPLAEEPGFVVQCRDTRDQAISLELVEVARKDPNSDNYVHVDSARQSSGHGRLSQDVYVRLTSAGRMLVNDEKR